MRITLLSIVYPVPRAGVLPGPERLAHRLADTLHRCGNDVTVVTSFWNGGEARDTVDGIRIMRVATSGDRLGRVGRAFCLHYRTWGRCIPRLTEALRGADVIHALSPLSSAAALRQSGLPVVATFHHLTRLRTPMDVLTVPWHNRLERRTFRHVDVVVTPSEVSKADLVEGYGVPPERVRVIPYGVDVPAALVASARNPSAILFVGILERRKGLQFLLNAMALLRRDFPQMRLRVVGQGPSGPELQRLARRLGFGDRIVFLGHVEDLELERLYASSGIFAFPSLQEGFGFAPLEAMAHGLPVVTTTAGSLPEVVQDAAICVPPGDPEALAGALRRLFEDAPLREALAARGREHVMRAFSWDATAQRLLDLYRSLAARGGGGA